MSNFDYMVSYLAAKGVQLVIKNEYVDGKPAGRQLLTKLVITKTGKFYRVNDKIVSTNMAKALIRMA